MLTATLYLQAVLPTLDELLQHSNAAQKILGSRTLTIRIVVSKHSAVTLHFENKRLILPPKPRQPHIEFHFHSPNQLIQLLRDNRPTFPHLHFPQKPCPHHLHILPRLLQTLQHQLQPPTGKDSLFLNLRLLLAIAYRALPYLAQQDSTTQSILKNTPQGLLSVQVANTDIAAWANWDGQHLTSSTTSAPPKSPDALITFQDALTAYHTFHETLDTHAAIGLHQLQIQGHLPLADQFSLLLERLPHFLPQ